MSAFLELIENFIDSGVGLISPKAQLSRMQGRNIIRSLNQYAAAKTTRLTGDWRPIDGNVNDIIRASSRQARARAQQLVRDFPPFKHANTVITDYTVGTGIGYQSQVRESLTSTNLDKKTNTLIEEGYKRWQEKEADASGKQHFTDLLRTAKRHESEDGEYILMAKWIPDPNRFSPFAVQLYDSRHFSDQAAGKIPSDNKFDQGVETDRSTGAVIAYHFREPDDFTEILRVPAEFVSHGFETLRTGQLRGISEFVSAIILAHSLSDYLSAEIDGAKMAAKWLAFVKTSNPGHAMSVSSVNENNPDQRIEELENAMIEYLAPGEEVTINSSNRPGSSFEPFTRLILRMIAISVDLSYELLSGDYQGINFSNLRGIRADVGKNFRPKQDRFIRQAVKPSFEGFLQGAVLNGSLKLKNYFTDPNFYNRGTFMPPGFESVDPLRETKSDIEQIENMLSSPQRVLARKGVLLEDILEENKAAKEMIEDAGLCCEDVSTALANNPAALDPDPKETSNA